MRLCTLAICLFLTAPAAMAQGQPLPFRLPQKSPQQRIVQELGLGKVELLYSRPGVKGRQMLGKYLPYDSLWRTGANMATRIRFTAPTQVGPTRLDTGSYSLYTIPGRQQWTVVLNKGYKNYGTYDYKKADDVARFTVPVLTNPAGVETLQFQFLNMKPESCDLELAWENWRVLIPIRQDIGAALRESAQAAEKSPKPPYAALAEYYHLHARNYPKALEMVNKAIAEYKGQKEQPYWLYLDKARILIDMGNRAEAKKASDESVRLATVAKDSDYVRQNAELKL